MPIRYRQYRRWTDRQTDRLGKTIWRSASLHADAREEPEQRWTLVWVTGAADLPATWRFVCVCVCVCVHRERETERIWFCCEHYYETVDGQKAECAVHEVDERATCLQWAARWEWQILARGIVNRTSWSTSPDRAVHTARSTSAWSTSLFHIIIIIINTTLHYTTLHRATSTCRQVQCWTRFMTDSSQHDRHSATVHGNPPAASCVCVCVCVCVLGQSCNCYQPRPQVADSGTASRYGG